MTSPTGVEHAPHFGGSVWLFWTCRPCLAPARLRPPHPKSRKHFSPKCAKQFCRSGFLSRREIGRREYLAYCQGQLRSMGGNPPGKTDTGSTPVGLSLRILIFRWRHADLLFKSGRKISNIPIAYLLGRLIHLNPAVLQ